MTVDCECSPASTTSAVDAQPPQPSCAHITANDFQVASLQAELTQLVDAASDEQQLLVGLAEIAADWANADWLALCRSPHPSADEQMFQNLHGEMGGNNSAFLQSCQQVALRATMTGSVSTARAALDLDCTVVAVPLPRRATESIVAVCPGRDLLPQTLPILQLISSNMATWDSDQRCRQATAGARQLAALTDLVSRVESCAGPNEACGVVVDALRGHLACEQIIIGLCKRDGVGCQVIAVSDAQSVDANSERTRLAEAVMQEAIVRGDLSVWPPTGDDDRHALCAHRQFAEAVRSEAIAGTVLRSETGKVHGVWLMVGETQDVHRAETLNFALATQRPLASALKLLAQARQNRFHRSLLGISQLARDSKGRTLLAAAAVLLAVMLTPFRYRVASDVEIQPVTRRFIAAPFESQLETTFVEPGDVVSKKQLLARLDGRDYRWELSAAEADLLGASKELAGFKVTHESAKAQIAQHEVDRLEMRKELLKHRVANLEIHSPIDGIVVAGDLKKSEGMPLTMGQALFEVAPLDEMVVEVSIPEDDVRLVRPGMPIRIWLDAFPMQRWDATIRRIHPRAEVKDHENVFVAEVSLTNPVGKLRPGMRGSARTATVRRPLAWNLFHKSAAATLRWLGW